MTALAEAFEGDPLTECVVLQDRQHPWRRRRRFELFQSGRRDEAIVAMPDESIRRRPGKPVRSRASTRPLRSTVMGCPERGGG